MSGRKTETWSVPTSPQSRESCSLILHFGAGIWAKWGLGDGGGHCLVFSISWRWLWRASLFLKLRSARSVAAREDTEEEANWWSMTPLWKDDRAPGLINSHGLRRLIFAAHLRRETAVLAPPMKRPIIAFGLCSWPERQDFISGDALLVGLFIYLFLGCCYCCFGYCGSPNLCAFWCVCVPARVLVWSLVTFSTLVRAVWPQTSVSGTLKREFKANTLMNN